MEIRSGRDGGILPYFQYILGGGDSVLVNKKEWGDLVRGGGGGGGGGVMGGWGFCPTLAIK